MTVDRNTHWQNWQIVAQPIVGGLVGLIPLLGSVPAIAQPSPPEEHFLRPQVPCPQDLETLTTALLRDLPGYANRVARSSLGVNEGVAGFGTILVAGRPEFEPIDFSLRTFSDRPDTEDEAIHQVFFTTLERQYTNTEALLLEQYHWLFLTEGEDGWRLALMFSRLAVEESSARPPTPPRESSEGIIGQAVQRWLRDCRAGAVYPVESPGETSGAGTGR